MDSEEENAEKERIRREEELRKELARKWTEERLPEAEKIFDDQLAAQIYSSAYLAELSKNGLNFDPPGFKSKEVTPGEASVTAKKTLALKRAENLRDDQEEYIEQGLKKADAAANGLAREKARNAEAEATEPERKESEQSQQEKAEHLTPSKRVSAVQNVAALEEAERRAAALLAERERDEGFVQAARETTERKVGDQPDGRELDKTEEDEPVEGTKDKTAEGKIEERRLESQPDPVPDIKVDHKLMEDMYPHEDAMAELLRRKHPEMFNDWDYER